jgi:hypothetical protein
MGWMKREKSLQLKEAKSWLLFPKYSDQIYQLLSELAYKLIQILLLQNYQHKPVKYRYGIISNLMSKKKLVLQQKQIKLPIFRVL